LGERSPSKVLVGRVRVWEQGTARERGWQAARICTVRSHDMNARVSDRVTRAGSGSPQRRVYPVSGTPTINRRPSTIAQLLLERVAPQCRQNVALGRMSA